MLLLANHLTTAYHVCIDKMSGNHPMSLAHPTDDYLWYIESISDVNITTESDSMVISAGNGSKTVCAENYYLNDDGKCMPRCILWVDPPGVGLDADNIAILIGLITAVISAVVLLIISVSVQRKIM